jgi:2-polyprenyl-6-hydroxyphenyl methylase/3-demethylubiquinone-9 3-methyltransferase
LPRGTHRWRKFVKPRELEDLLKLGGFDVIAQTGVQVNPLTRGFSLTRTMSINYMIVARHGISQTIDRRSLRLVVMI